MEVSENVRLPQMLDGLEYIRFDTADQTAEPVVDSKVSKVSVSDTKRAIRWVRLVFKWILGFGRCPLSIDASTAARLKWLEKQYDKGSTVRALTETTYRPQPYEQLAKVLRHAGNYEGAAIVLLEKLKKERVIMQHGTMRVLYRILESQFRYGLFVCPVARVFFIAWIIGWHATDVANYGNFRFLPVGGWSLFTWTHHIIPEPTLVIDSLPTSSVALRDATSASIDIATEAGTQVVTDPTSIAREIPCKDQIEPSLYALDVFVPLLDLKQESKCQISSDPGAWEWRIKRRRKRHGVEVEQEQLALPSRPNEVWPMDFNIVSMNTSFLCKFCHKVSSENHRWFALQVRLYDPRCQDSLYGRLPFARVLSALTDR